jgi:glutamine---fructose-6-phosphate transaminase (isomerizing)
MHKMLKEIHEQPDVITRLVAKQLDAAKEAANAIRKRECRFAVMAARGTSDNAATFGKYLFEIVNGIPVGLAAPSVYTLYDANLDLRDAVVLGISQSGCATDVNEYLDKARKHGAVTVGITNEPGSDICSVSDHVVLCEAGKEESVAATKTYTATLGTLYLISSALSGNDNLIEGLLNATEAMKKAFKCEEFIQSKVERYRFMQECFVVARGLNHATGFEISLKMSETSYLSTKPYSAADLMHGPIAVVHEGYPCMLIAPTGKSIDVMIDLAKNLKARKAEIIALSDCDEILDIADCPIHTPNGLDELFTPLVYIVYGQLFAYYLSVVKGNDPDKPRGLSKVTLTR